MYKLLYTDYSDYVSLAEAMEKMMNATEQNGWEPYGSMVVIERSSHWYGFQVMRKMETQQIEVVFGFGKKPENAVIDALNGTRAFCKKGFKIHGPFQMIRPDETQPVWACMITLVM